MSSRASSVPVASSPFETSNGLFLQTIPSLYSVSLPPSWDFISRNLLPHLIPFHPAISSSTASSARPAMDSSSSRHTTHYDICSVGEAGTASVRLSGLQPPASPLVFTLHWCFASGGRRAIEGGCGELPAVREEVEEERGGGGNRVSARRAALSLE